MLGKILKIVIFGLIIAINEGVGGSISLLLIYCNGNFQNAEGYYFIQPAFGLFEEIGGGN